MHDEDGCYSGLSSSLFSMRVRYIRGLESRVVVPPWALFHCRPATVIPGVLLPALVSVLYRRVAAVSEASAPGWHEVLKY